MILPWAGPVSGGPAVAAIEGGAATPTPIAIAVAVARQTPMTPDRLGAAAATPVVAAPATADSAAEKPTRVQPDPIAALYGTETFWTISNAAYTAPVDCGGFSCQIGLDVYVPAGPGPHPTVVLIRGGPSSLGGRAYLNSFAGLLASAGMLVYNADYRDRASEGGGYPAAFQDVACAIRYARATAPGLGGDGIVTLVGHSLGGWVGSVVALDANEFQGGCLYDGRGRPDDFVGLAGNYDLRYRQGDLFGFFGGGSAETAAARTASDPFNYATRAPIPVRLVAGTNDTTVYPEASVALDSLLVSRGWNVGLALVPDGTHMSIMAPSVGAPTTLHAIYSAISAARSTADAIDPLRGRSGQ